MAVTQVHLVGKEESFQEIEKLVNSHILHGSESLCKLLRYLAEQALNHPGTSVKEYQIATELFGRPANFDPHMDATVRVQAGRLRMKLAEYYNSVGAQDSIVVELPKGSYALSFHQRPAISSDPYPKIVNSPIAPPGGTARVLRRWKFFTFVLALVLLISLGVITQLIARRPGPVATGNDQIAAAYQLFWRPFVSSREEPWVIFSNGAFVGRPETGMRYFNAQHDPSSQVILDHYTGVGEVLAVHELDRVFALLKKQIRVKRGTLFSLDDAKNNDLIFVGSPAENLTLREIPSTHEFVFQRLASGPRAGDLSVVNLHPEASEPKMFLPTRPNEVLAEDYAVVGLERGLDPSHAVLILAGTTTIGTQAAVEYVCHQDSLEELISRLRASQTGELPPFEAVLRVKVVRGVPVKTELVALRRPL